MKTLIEKSTDLSNTFDRLLAKVALLKAENTALASQLETVKTGASLEKNNQEAKIRKLEERLNELTEEQATLKTKTKKIALAKNQELLDSELDKKMIKFVIDKQSQHSDKELFLKKIDESIAEIDLCIAFLKEI